MEHEVQVRSVVLPKLPEPHEDTHVRLGGAEKRKVLAWHDVHCEDAAPSHVKQELEHGVHTLLAKLAKNPALHEGPQVPLAR